MYAERIPSQLILIVLQFFRFTAYHVVGKGGLARESNLHTFRVSLEMVMPVTKKYSFDEMDTNVMVTLAYLQVLIYI